MRALWRMVRLVAAYPARFATFTVASLAVSGITAAFLGLMHAILTLLQNANDGEPGAPVGRPEIPAGVARTPILGDLAARAADFYAGWTPKQAFFVLVAVGVVLFVLKCAIAYMNRYLEGWLRGRVIRDAQTKLARHLLSLDFSFFQGERQGELVSRLTNDLSLLGRSVRMACTLLAKPLTLVAAIGYIIWLDWQLTLIALGLLPLGMAALSALARKIRRAARKAQEKTADLTEIMMQFLSGMRIVKAFACEDFEAAQFERENDKLFRVSMKRVRARAAERIVSEFMTSFASLSVLTLGGWWVFSGRLDLATLMTFYIGLAAIYSPINEISHLYGDFQENVAGALRVFELMDRQPSILPGPRNEPPADHTVRFEDVHFAYREGAPVLNGLELVLPAGKTVALVGRTGSGKSTMADLLLRLRDPDAGRITMGGTPLPDFTFAALRGAVALVNQDSFLFNSSLRDNIAYGTPADPERLEAAARAAHIHDEIMTFPDGYDTVVGERGTNLSGGQRQRIAIARALYKDAPILILDEATSSLDAGSERRVQEALARLFAGRTCLVIAHRLSTVRRADAIAWLENGRIAAIGTHEEMLECSPVYASFVAMQTEG